MLMISYYQFLGLQHLRKRKFSLLSSLQAAAQFTRSIEEIITKPYLTKFSSKKIIVIDKK